GTNSADSINLSVAEATQALDAFNSGARQLETVEHFELFQSNAAEFVAAGRSLVLLLEANEIEAARQLAESTFSVAFDNTSDSLVIARDELADTIEASDLFLGRVGNIARFLVAFLIPAAIVFIYRALLARQQRQAELESRLEAERVLNAAREAFVANASHELRTPLTSIVGMSLLLAETEAIQGDAMATELLDVIVGESDDLSRMVEDLLTTARLDAGALHFAFQDIDVEEELEGIVDPLRRSGFDIAVDAKAGVVRGDRLRFRQILRNLLSNARKYGGPQIRIEGRVERRTYVCSIIDNGDGIPDELVPKLFKRFIHQGHQTATKDSVGLGLSIVHALAHGMGGSVSHERIGDETYFSLRMPLAGKKSAAEAESGAPEEALPVASEPT
ncbi:MAG: hypothetical protein KJO84_03525, partial [Acidimicrobiia bacterium]|nr:hypothetical protein [Acidimicrobiia bacterium]